MAVTRPSLDESRRIVLDSALDVAREIMRERGLTFRVVTTRDELLHIVSDEVEYTVSLIEQHRR